MLRYIKEGVTTIRAVWHLISDFFVKWFLPVEYDDTEVESLEETEEQEEHEEQGEHEEHEEHEEQEERKAYWPYPEEPPIPADHTEPSETVNLQTAVSIYDELPPPPDAGPWDASDSDGEPMAEQADAHGAELGPENPEAAAASDVEGEAEAPPEEPPRLSDAP